jgi:uncharacterized DUF497 family protein
LLVLEIQQASGEERTKMVGMTRAGRILVVVITMRMPKIRPITAYDAVERDKENYLKNRHS